ncbi:MAG: HEAT repeat domain-containing protein [Thermodesulfobacteriota bacterium]
MVAEQELWQVMADFLDMGHVENIMAMVRQDPSFYRFTGDLLRDERFMVRVGVAVLFEAMREERPNEVALAIPSLKPLLSEPTPWVRGEAANILGLINTPEALELLATLRDDPEPQIREIVGDYLPAAPEGAAKAKGKG